jgi:hypothetical protein
MRKAFLIVTASVAIAATSLAGSALAQNRGDRADRTAPTDNQIVAQEDARVAHIKADLRLTPEQEKNWSVLESALHDIGKNRADRQARDNRALASNGLRGVLALEVPMSRWSTTVRQRGSGPDPKNEF